MRADAAVDVPAGDGAEEAAVLASSDAPIEERVDGAKTLQQRWRKIGITPRRPDQELWRKLRSACDSVFADRENQQKAADDSRKAAQKTANECLAEIEAAVANEAEPSRESLRQYRHRFKALEKLPAHPPPTTDNSTASQTDSVSHKAVTQISALGVSTPASSHFRWLVGVCKNARTE